MIKETQKGLDIGVSKSQELNNEKEVAKINLEALL